jgi:hypothetical protein
MVGVSRELMCRKLRASFTTYIVRKSRAYSREIRRPEMVSCEVSLVRVSKGPQYYHEFHELGHFKTGRKASVPDALKLTEGRGAEFA